MKRSEQEERLHLHHHCLEYCACISNGVSGGGESTSSMSAAFVNGMRLVMQYSGGVSPITAYSKVVVGGSREDNTQAATHVS